MVGEEQSEWSTGVHPAPTPAGLHSKSSPNTGRGVPEQVPDPLFPSPVSWDHRGPSQRGINDPCSGHKRKTHTHGQAPFQVGSLGLGSGSFTFPVTWKGVVRVPQFDTGTVCRDQGALAQGLRLPIQRSESSPICTHLADPPGGPKSGGILSLPQPPALAFSKAII